MCGRYTLTAPVGVLASLFPGVELPADLQPRYNIAPGQTAPVLYAPDGAPRVELLHWGLVPHWAREPSIGSRMINARAESLLEKPAFRGLVARRRCAVPADGFYEWGPAGDGTRQPFYVRRVDGRPFAFAGLWDQWSPPGGGPALRSFTIVTTEANGAIRPVHHRMPVILWTDDTLRRWTAAEGPTRQSLAELLAPCPSGLLEVYPVSRLVNSPANDGPACIRPLASPGDGEEGEGRPPDSPG